MASQQSTSISPCSDPRPNGCPSYFSFRSNVSKSDLCRCSDQLSPSLTEYCFPELHARRASPATTFLHQRSVRVQRSNAIDELVQARIEKAVYSIRDELAWP